MDRVEVVTELSTLEGTEVSFRRIAGNTIILYFHGQPGEQGTTSIRIDPSWRYSIAGEWLLGSGDIPWEEDVEESPEEFRLRFDEVCDVCEKLSGSIIERIELEQDSFDLDLRFSGEQRLTTFAGYTSEESWVYTNRLKDLRIEGSLVDYDVQHT